MREGWSGGEYLTLFDEPEAAVASTRYAVERWLPAHRVVGLRGWDDLLVQAPSGQVFSVPSVPIAREHLEPFVLPANAALEADARFTGKVKWYVQPLAFGGAPSDEVNVSWVSHEQHAELVVWWNSLHRDLSASTAGA